MFICYNKINSVLVYRMVISLSNQKDLASYGAMMNATGKYLKSKELTKSICTTYMFLHKIKTALLATSLLHCDVPMLFYFFRFVLIVPYRNYTIDYLLKY